jgi:predicted ABC-type ATPase
VKTDNAIYINSDDVKEKLPGYEGWNAAHYHEESSDVSKTAEQLARDHRLNVILDGTMSKRDSLHTRIEQYKAAGYRIEGHFMRVKPETSAKRALERFVRKGRFVPPEHVLSLGANLGNFEGQRANMAAWEIYDNEGKAPELVARGVRAGEGKGGGGGGDGEAVPGTAEHLKDQLLKQIDRDHEVQYVSESGGELGQGSISIRLDNTSHEYGQKVMEKVGFTVTSPTSKTRFGTSTKYSHLDGHIGSVTTNKKKGVERTFISVGVKRGENVPVEALGPKGKPSLGKLPVGGSGKPGRKKPKI